jgi:hypothetical protein
MSDLQAYVDTDEKGLAGVDCVEELKKNTPNNHVKGNALLVRKDGEVRKIPIPSNNPNDPLNFRPWEKIGIIFCCCWFSIMGLSIASGLGPILNVFFEMYMLLGYNTDQVVFLITIPPFALV